MIFIHFQNKEKVKLITVTIHVSQSRFIRKKGREKKFIFQRQRQADSAANHSWTLSRTYFHSGLFHTKLAHWTLLLWHSHSEFGQLYNDEWNREALFLGQILALCSSSFKTVSTTATQHKEPSRVMPREWRIIYIIGNYLKARSNYLKLIQMQNCWCEK